tara:strand:+ start:672 stop:1175 length:504 start_codon:yes stop_codon:yes gene_type:complete
MSHRILKVQDAKRVLLNHGYCEVLAVNEKAENRSDGNEGIQLWFRPNGGAWDGCSSGPISVFYADETAECPEIADVLLLLSINDAEALVDILMSHPGVRAARMKRYAEEREKIEECSKGEVDVDGLRRLALKMVLQSPEFVATIAELSQAQKEGRHENGNPCESACD